MISPTDKLFFDDHVHQGMIVFWQTFHPMTQTGNLHRDWHEIEILVDHHSPSRHRGESPRILLFHLFETGDTVCTKRHSTVSNHEEISNHGD